MESIKDLKERAYDLIAMLEHAQNNYNAYVNPISAEIKQVNERIAELSKPKEEIKDQW